MKALLPIFSIISLFLIEFEPQHSSSNDPGFNSFVDSLFQESIDSAKIAGGALMVIHKGETLVNKAYGYASMELKVPMPENGVFEIGSVTKQFTSAAILKLAEAGKLSLKDDFTKYLNYDTKGRKISIHNLLNHTSGIAGYTEIPEFWDLSLQDHPQDSLVRLVEQKDHLFEPNEALVYNNSAYFFLGLIIEEITGQSYAEYLSEVFFNPLAMKNTCYCSSSKVIENKVYGYSYTPDGLNQKMYLNHKWPYAAGSLCSTKEDMYKWLTALHNGEVLSPDSYKQFIRPTQLNDGTPLRYAMGLTNFKNNGHQEISHGGGIHGFLSDTRYYPDQDLYIICFVNTTGPHGAAYFSEAVTWKLLDKISPKTIVPSFNSNGLNGKYVGASRGSELQIEIKTLKNAITLQYDDGETIDTLTSYLGNYTWMDGNDIISIKNNALHIDKVYGHYILEKKK